MIRNMRGTTSAAAATIRAVGAGQRQGSCDHAGGLRSRVRAPDRPVSSRFASLDTSATAKGWQLRGGRERCRNPQASARPCKRICKPDAARRAEVAKTTGMPGDGRPTFAVVGSDA